MTREACLQEVAFSWALKERETFFKLKHKWHTMLYYVQGYNIVT